MASQTPIKDKIKEGKLEKERQQREVAEATAERIRQRNRRFDELIRTVGTLANRIFYGKSEEGGGSRGGGERGKG